MFAGGGLPHRADDLVGATGRMSRHPRVTGRRGLYSVGGRQAWGGLLSSEGLHGGAGSRARAEAKAWDVSMTGTSLEEPGGPGVGARVRAGGLGVTSGRYEVPTPDLIVHEENTQGSAGRAHHCDPLQEKGAGERVCGRGPGSSFQSLMGTPTVPPAPGCAVCEMPALRGVQHSHEMCGLGRKVLGSSPTPAPHWPRDPGRVA